jgi:hypothetical protein
MEFAFVELGSMRMGRSLWMGVLVVSLSGNYSYAEGQALQERASSPPDSRTLQQALAPGYVTPVGFERECFGRLAFDTPRPVEWATQYSGAGSIFNGAFSKQVFDQGDNISVGNTKIAVLGPLSADMIDKVLGTTPNARMRRLEDLIKSGRKFIEEASSKNASDIRQYDLDFMTRGVAGNERTLEELRTKYRDFDVPAGWTGYSTTRDDSGNPSIKYSVYGAYLRAGNFVYVFESLEEISAAMTRELHGRMMIEFLQKFRTRKAGEVPSDIGICIPYGFIPDDGTLVSDLKQSVRWPDAPGVLYTIHTGNVKARQLKVPQLLAASRAAVGLMGTADEEQIKPFVTKRIGPHPYKIGGLTGEQGGVALRVNEKGKTPYESYSIFTGYSGWLGSEVLPFILVDMRSHTPEQAPELKQNPPPFKQSMERLEVLLKSMRLRQTSPSMRELAQLKK